MIINIFYIYHDAFCLHFRWNVWHDNRHWLSDRHLSIDLFWLFDVMGQSRAAKIIFYTTFRTIHEILHTKKFHRSDFTCKLISWMEDYRIDSGKFINSKNSYFLDKSKILTTLSDLQFQFISFLAFFLLSKQRHTHSVRKQVQIWFQNTGNLPFDTHSLVANCTNQSTCIFRNTRKFHRAGQFFSPHSTTGTSTRNN